jgi:hypothetical protein
VGISPIGCYVGLLQLCIVDLCNIFELLDDMLEISCMYLLNLMMKYD